MDIYKNKNFNNKNYTTIVKKKMERNIKIQSKWKIMGSLISSFEKLNGLTYYW